MLTDDLRSVVENSSVVIVSHRLSDDLWKTVDWTPGQRIVDLANVPALQRLPNYEGIYW